MTKYLPELQRRLLMRKLKLMDSHGVPNFDTPDSDRSVSARYESDVDGRESELGLTVAWVGVRMKLHAPPALGTPE